MSDIQEFNVLFEIAKANYSDELLALFNRYGNQTNKDFIELAAFNTQLVIKKNLPNFNHGYLLYYALSKYLENYDKNDNIYILDVGTARGFSSLVMSHVIKTFKQNGVIISIDKVRHKKKIKWKSVLDGEFGISRKEIVDRFSESDRIIFTEGKSKKVLTRLNISRVNFAFVDGDHNWRSLKTEISYLIANQRQGDVILFDDYSPKFYPDVVKAVNSLKGFYEIEIFGDTSVRGYALLTKN
jgi:hypothetical protein